MVKRLLVLLRPQRWKVAVSASCRIANQGLGVAIPAIAVALVFGVADESARVSNALLILGALALVKGAFRYLEQYTGHAVAFRLLAELRNEVFRWLQRVEPARLQDERSGDLVARISGDIDRIEPFYAHTIAPLLSALVVPVLTLVGMAWAVDPLVALALAPFLILYVALVPWIGWSGLAATRARARRMSGEAAAAIADTVQGAREIAILGAGRRVVAALGRSDRDRMALERRIADRTALRSLVGGLLSAGALSSVALTAAGRGLALAELSVSIVLAWTVMAPIRALEQVVPDTEQSLAAAARLFELEEMPAQPSGDFALTPGNGEVRFDALVVRAASETLVDSVTLEVPDGSFVGIVGPSGSGKTSLVESLVRYRDPSSGQVLVGGVPVTALSPSAVASHVALVPQRPDVFHGTLLSNLLMAKPGADEDDLTAAIHRAQLGDWADTLDDGLHTDLGPGGAGMSGGQLQRLALARAFLRDPAVLVLDEATSELDAATERAILEEVLSERGRRTVVVVAHRMETVARADLIVVMNRGRVVETGVHSELKRSDGLYAALWRRHEDLLALA